MEIKPPIAFQTYDGKFDVQVFHLRPGEGVPRHQHQLYAHDMFISQGTVRVQIGPISKELMAPDTVHFPNGALHNFEAVTDALVVTVHPLWQ
jgi:quercetin dioxygenase-like cupin family protein